MKNKLQKEQDKKYIMGMLKRALSPKNVLNFAKNHWKELVTTGGIVGGGFMLCGCIRTNTPPANIQSGEEVPSGIPSGSIISGDTEKPSEFESGNINSGNQEKPGEIESGETNSGEQPPEKEYPTTIAEMTDSQKKILVDYLDKTYKQRIIRKVISGANLENTETIGYEIDETSINALYKTINADGINYYSANCPATNDIVNIIKAIVDNEDFSDFITIKTAEIIYSNVFTIPTTDNEYTVNAKTAYNFLNNQLETPKTTNASTQYFAKEYNSAMGFGQICPRVNYIAFTIENNKTIINSKLTVSPFPNKLGIEDVEFDVREENYLEFGGENTIYIDKLNV